MLFAIGSVCFAAGSAPGYVEVVGDSADAITYFIGSLFFTTAAGFQLVEVANAASVAAPMPRRRRLVTVEIHRIDWWACAVQFAGTLWFNVTTFHGITTSLSASNVNQLVWRPDALGSICFLVASGLAYAELTHRWFSWHPRSMSWWIVALNLLGSIAFGVSAVASKVVTETTQVRNVALMNLGTFLGAVCFLIGAVLLLPERTHPHPEP